MINKKSIYYLRLFTDLLLLIAAFLISAAAAQSLEILMQRNYMFILLALLIFLWYFTSNVVSFYEDFNTRYFSFQFINILKSVLTQAVAAVLFIFLTKEDLFTRNFILLYAMMLTLFISIRIPVLRYLLARIRGREGNIRNVVIVGGGETGKSFHEMILSHQEFGYNFSGYLDDTLKPEDDKKYLGSISNLNSILSAGNIDEVIIALSIYASNQLDEIIKICNRHAVRVHIIPDYFRFVSKKFRVSMIGNFPIITVRAEPLGEAHWRFLKRIFDLIFSSIVLLLVFSWLLPLLFIVYKVTSSGKMIFAQDRVGAGDKLFKCYKFRTMDMSKGKEEFNPAVDDDPRVTKLGRLLRKTNLDELPQFINVFVGDMSVVGPRPHPVPFNNEYKKMVDEIKLRSWVKPGITGWAQVHGLRGDVIDYEVNKQRTIKRIEYDLWYIENWTFWLDIQIILLTLWQMIKGETRGI